MSRPHVFPHTAIGEFVKNTELSAPEQRRLYSALADSLGSGARVVLLLWEAPDWQLLAVQPPEDTEHLSTPEVLALVDDWPEKVALMLSKSRRGAHYTCIELRRQPSHSSVVH